MKKLKLIGAVTGRVYEVEPHKLKIDDKTGIKFIKTATEFAFEAVEKKKEVKKETPKKTAPKAKPVEEVKEEVKEETEKEA